MKLRTDYINSKTTLLLLALQAILARLSFESPMLLTQGTKSRENDRNYYKLRLLSPMGETDSVDHSAKTNSRTRCLTCVGNAVLINTDSVRVLAKALQSQHQRVK